MKELMKYLSITLMIMFWIIRIIIELASELVKEFLGGIKPINSTFEIALLFLTLVCIVLVARRNLVGGLAYLALYAVYFGGNITNKLINSTGSLSLVDSVDIALSIFGIIIALFVVIDILIDKKQRLNPKDEKNDWFFNNKNYDRKLDERADKNKYRTM